MGLGCVGDLGSQVTIHTTCVSVLTKTTNFLGKLLGGATIGGCNNLKRFNCKGQGLNNI